ncbi:MAG: RDD family protein [Acidimicrobiales bacterium]
MASWYYAVGSQTRGPVSEDELRAMAQRSELNAASYVVRDGESVWQTLAEVAAGLRLVPNATGGFQDAASVPPPLTGAGATVWGGPPPAGDQGPSGWGAPAPGLPGPSVPGPSVPGPSGGWGGGTQPWTQQQPDQGPWGQPAANPYAAPAGQYTTWSPTGPAGAYGIGPGAIHPDLLASWGKRFLAKVVDTVLIVTVYVVLIMAFARDDLQDINAQDNQFQLALGGNFLLAQLLAALIGFAYLALLNGRGQTLGKMMVGIRVVHRQTGQPIGAAKGLLRHLIQFFASFLSCFGAVFVLVDSLWPLWDSNNQTLHDKVAGSVVIKAG